MRLLLDRGAPRIGTGRRRIGEEPCNAALLVERGRWYYRRQEWGKALNDFNRALGIDPARDEARQYAEQIEEILAFRYKDIYNP